MSRKLTIEQRFNKALDRAINLHIQERDFFNNPLLNVEENVGAKLQRAEKHLDRMLTLVLEEPKPDKFPANNLLHMVAATNLCNIEEVTIKHCFLPENSEKHGYTDTVFNSDVSYIVRLSVPMTFVPNGGYSIVDYLLNKDGSIEFLNC